MIFPMRQVDLLAGTIWANPFLVTQTKYVSNSQHGLHQQHVTHSEESEREKARAVSPRPCDRSRAIKAKFPSRGQWALAARGETGFE